WSTAATSKIPEMSFELECMSANKSATARSIALVELHESAATAFNWLCGISRGPAGKAAAGLVTGAVLDTVCWAHALLASRVVAIVPEFTVCVIAADLLAGKIPSPRELGVIVWRPIDSGEIANAALPPSRVPGRRVVFPSLT